MNPRKTKPEIVIDQRRIMQKKRGRAAELEIESILNQLDKSRYAVFHDITARYGNIDHLVISREGGIFLVETKGHRGKVSVERGKIYINGDPMKRDPVAQMSRNIRWLKEVIREKLNMTVWIVSIIVFTNAVVYSSRGKPVLRLQPVHRMNVIQKGHLKRLIESYYPKNTKRRIWNNRHDLFLTNVHHSSPTV